MKPWTMASLPNRAAKVIDTEFFSRVRATLKAGSILKFVCCQRKPVWPGGISKIRNTTYGTFTLSAVHLYYTGFTARCHPVWKSSYSACGAILQRHARWSGSPLIWQYKLAEERCFTIPEGNKEDFQSERAAYRIDLYA